MAEGYYDYVKKNYIYHYVDHLDKRFKMTHFKEDCERSSMRVSFSRSAGAGLQLEEAQDYYPFGMLHRARNGMSNPYQYKYNGKELQETGMYDYGARFYMPDIGRWEVVDPLAEKLPSFSPYAYVRVNPINRVDPDGRFDSKFGAWMHKIFHGHWNSDIQQNTNKDSKMYGQYFYTYQPKENRTNTDRINYQTVNGEKVGIIAQVTLPTKVYNTAQEHRTVEALRNTAEKLDYVAVTADVTAIALGPETLGAGSVVAEAVSYWSGVSSFGLNAYADLLQGHYKTTIGRAIIFGVTAGISSKIQSWEHVIGNKNARILEGHNVIYEKIYDKALEKCDEKTYKPIKQEEQ